MLACVSLLFPHDVTRHNTMSVEESKASIESKTEDVRRERRERTSVSEVEEKHPVGVYEMENGSLIDIYSYHEQRAGSLVVTPEYVCS